MCENQKNIVLKIGGPSSNLPKKKFKWCHKLKPQPKVFFKRKNGPTMVITHDPDHLA